jgi:hypothetical protein
VQSKERYAINALGPAANLVLTDKRINLGFKFFEEFADRSTFQGYSLQISGAISF